jgi:gluconate 2-dehydrogenase gamma chain
MFRIRSPEFFEPGTFHPEAGMNNQIIERRMALKYFTILAASAAGQEFLASWLPAAAGGVRPVEHAFHHDSSGLIPQNSAEPYTPNFFKPEEFKTVEMLTQLIIPTDDQPGAKEAKVAQYIDFVVFAAAERARELQKQWTQGLALLDSLSQKKHNQPFRELASRDQEQLLLEMSLPEKDPQAHHPGFEFYRLVKDMTVEGFYTSKIGLIDVLGYQGRTFLSEFPGCTHPEHQG